MHTQADAAPKAGSRDSISYVLMGAIGLTTGVALRFWTRSGLWLDEVLTVNIAALPVRHIPAALRHDGAPPLYYVVLHYWMAVFGKGNLAVRAFSSLTSVVSLPFAWAAGRRLGGRACAAATVVLMATSPFAVLSTRRWPG